FVNSMFLLPDQLVVQGGEMYVRFPTASLSLRKGIRAMWLHFALPDCADATVVQIWEVKSAWDEQVFQQARPLRAERMMCQAACTPFQTEDAAAIDSVLEKWMFQRENYGLYVAYAHQGYSFDTSKPPYLEIVQEPARDGVTAI